MMYQKKRQRRKPLAFKKVARQHTEGRGREGVSAHQPGLKPLQANLHWF